MADSNILQQLALKRALDRQTQAVSHSVVKLGLDLLTFFYSKKRENVILSPSGLFFVLSMLLGCARGETQREIVQALGLAEVEGNILNQINQRKILDLDGSSFQSVSFANALFTSKSVKIDENFADLISSYYHAYIAGIDFGSAAELEQVDLWVRTRTNNRILSISDLLEPTSALAIVNVLYFKDQWTYPFAPGNTRKEQFYVELGAQCAVAMMQQTEYFGYNTFYGHQFVSLPYSSRTCDMLLVLPFENSSPEKFLSEFSAPSWAAGSFPSKRLTISLPKFVFQNSFGLEPFLKSLGIEKLFERDLADLSGLAQNGPLFIDQFKQKVWLEVDERGTEASFVTVATAMWGAAPGRTHEPPLEIKFNRPFLFFLRNLISGDILASGIIRNPGLAE